ncbi:MAG TPA: 1-deoxy-D-xylulose-5-phosphate reductoisomerase [Actinomycetota bacterium]|nr:1-deoxy-D-xylulose-5-phosphate reductoisomerase [Actinomycetota bacterium]
MRRVIILGSTGSIGTQALDVIRRNPERFEVAGLAAASNQDLLVGQIREFIPPVVAVSDEAAAMELRAGLGELKGLKSVDIVAGPEAAETIAQELEADVVLNAMVGSVGLGPTLAALQSGKTLALANKESLIVGGELVMDLVKGEPERLVPVDSEHAALAQCLRGERRDDLRRVIVTASGGPFRGWSHEELGRASVKEALAHPTWKMGPKITIDSATLMNKGLEVIEAHYLFNLEYSHIDVVVHPESIVHGIAEFDDGAMMAQLSTPDMRLPIQLALAYPERLPTGVQSLDLAALGKLTFEDLDREAFPAVDLCYRAGRAASTYPAVLNAANEVAVMAFLEGKLPMTGIPDVVAQSLDEHDPMSVVSEVSLDRADAWARHRASEIIETR